jgi:hypothetical protein
VDPVPDPLLFFSGSAGNRTRASGSVAKSLSAHKATKFVKVFKMRKQPREGLSSAFVCIYILTGSYKSACIRNVEIRFSVAFLEHRANAELVPVSPGCTAHVSYETLPILTCKCRPSGAIESLVYSKDKKKSRGSTPFGSSWCFVFARYSLPLSLTPNMEVVPYSETSVDYYRNIRRYFPEGRTSPAANVSPNSINRLGSAAET